jgi:hypothetical protein
MHCLDKYCIWYFSYITVLQGEIERKNYFGIPVTCPSLLTDFNQNCTACSASAVNARYGVSFMLLIHRMIISQIQYLSNQCILFQWNILHWLDKYCICCFSYITETHNSQAANTRSHLSLKFNHWICTPNAQHDIPGMVFNHRAFLRAPLILNY